MKIRYSLCTITTEQIVTILEGELWTITKLDIDEMNAALRVIYKHPEPNREFPVSKTEILADFAETRQVYSNAATLEMIMALFPLFIFKPCFERFYETRVGLV